MLLKIKKSYCFKKLMNPRVLNNFNVIWYAPQTISRVFPFSVLYFFRWPEELFFFNFSVMAQQKWRVLVKIQFKAKRAMGWHGFRGRLYREFRWTEYRDLNSFLFVLLFFWWMLWVMVASAEINFERERGNTTRGKGIIR